MSRHPPHPDPGANLAGKSGPEQKPPSALAVPQIPHAEEFVKSPRAELDPKYETSHPVKPSAVDPNPAPLVSAAPPRPVAGVDQVPPADPVYDPAFNAAHPKPGHDTFPARDPVE